MSSETSNPASCLNVWCIQWSRSILLTTLQSILILWTNGSCWANRNPDCNKRYSPLKQKYLVAHIPARTEPQNTSNRMLVVGLLFTHLPTTHSPWSRVRPNAGSYRKLTAQSALFGPAPDWYARAIFWLWLRNNASNHGKTKRNYGGATHTHTHTHIHTGRWKQERCGGGFALGKLMERNGLLSEGFTFPFSIGTNYSLLANCGILSMRRFITLFKLEQHSNFKIEALFLKKEFQNKRTLF